jgi:hypothetical protein
MGEVFLAEDTKLARKVALKLIRSTAHLLKQGQPWSFSPSESADGRWLT